MLQLRNVRAHSEELYKAERVKENEERREIRWQKEDLEAKRAWAKAQQHFLEGVGEKGRAKGGR